MTGKIYFDLDTSWVNNIKINLSAVERRTATLTKRRTVKKEYQVAWLLKAITLIDLTTLSGDDTFGKVERLCNKALNPIDNDILSGLGLKANEIKVGAVCVYHHLIKDCKTLVSNQLPIAAVSTGFPAGLSSFGTRKKEISDSIRDGADEIDIVINRGFVLQNNWIKLYEEVKEFKKTAGNTKIKAILGVGDLETLRNVAKASLVCMMAGADFIKTSTGKENVNANNISDYFSGIILLNENKYKDSYKYLKKLDGLEKDHLNYSSKYLYSLVNSGYFNKAFNFSKKLEKEQQSSFESDLIIGIYHFKNLKYDLSNQYFLKAKKRNSISLLENYIADTLLVWSKLNKSQIEEAKLNLKKLDNRFVNLKRIQEVFLSCFLNQKNTNQLFFELTSDSKTDFSRYNYFYASYVASKGNINDAKKIVSSALTNHPRNLLLNQYKIK